MPHRIALTFGLLYWRADRWMQAAQALPVLPRVADALEAGDVSIYKVEELVRFATPEEEDALVEWARDVPSGAIRAEAERRRKAEASEASLAEEERYLRWRKSEDGGSFEMHAQLPAVEGELVADAIDRIADQLPGLTGEQHPALSKASREELRADALVALVTGTPEVPGSSAQRPVLMVHAPLDALLDAQAQGAGWTERGVLVPPETLKRLLCDSDLRMVVEDATGVPSGEVRGPRAPSPKMLRQLRHRDRRCVFPNCSHSRFVNAHHILWWSQGGRTDMGNLVLLCTFHHKLVHEHGWSLQRDAHDGVVRWFRPDGTGYRAGPRAA